MMGLSDMWTRRLGQAVCAPVIMQELTLLHAQQIGILQMELECIVQDNINTT